MTIQINETAASRIIVQDEKAREAGFAPAETWFAVGTRLMSAGRETYKQD